jgi:signal transduction histidine kinase/ActR/RegA family two-component response regulator
MDEREAYAPIDRALRAGMLYGSLVAAAGLVAAYLLASGFTRPVRRLVQAAARVADGDYNLSVPIKSADELGTLSASFNEMTAAIRARGDQRDQAEAALREANRRKDEFLAMLGHELRNPLSAVANAVLLWKKNGDDSPGANLVRDIIERQTGHLKRLVDDLLDVVRITSGKIELRKQPVEVNDVIAHAVEAVRPLLDERHHTIHLSLAGSDDLFVDADSMRLEQIVTNLLTNSAKYTPDGGRINIHAHRQNSEAIITVSDNGIGIAPGVLAEIFDLFKQADCSLDRTSGGLGIGLNLCRKLVELHGGSICARSDGAGHGAEFIVRLPAVAKPEQGLASPARIAPAGRHRRILLADDHKDTVRPLSRLLTRCGHEVFTAYDGLDALKAAHEFHPDAFLLDIGLPGLDGYTLARRLREEGFAGTSMIAISGYAQEHDRALARDAGFDHHFSKPVDFEALAALLAEEESPAMPELAATKNG